MLLEKNFTSRMMYILLFLFSLNIFNQSSLILAAVFILVVIYDREKLHIPANDNVFFVLVIFAVAFFLFSGQNGLSAGISAIGCPMAYYIGLRVQNEQMEISQAVEIRDNAIGYWHDMSCCCEFPIRVDSFRWNQF